MAGNEGDKANSGNNSWNPLGLCHHSFDFWKLNFLLRCLSLSFFYFAHHTFINYIFSWLWSLFRFTCACRMVKHFQIFMDSLIWRGWISNYWMPHHGFLYVLFSYVRMHCSILSFLTIGFSLINWSNFFKSWI